MRRNVLKPSSIVQESVDPLGVTIGVWSPFVACGFAGTVAWALAISLTSAPPAIVAALLKIIFRRESIINLRDDDAHVRASVVMKEQVPVGWPAQVIAHQQRAPALSARSNNRGGRQRIAAAHPARPAWHAADRTRQATCRCSAVAIAARSGLVVAGSFRDTSSREFAPPRDAHRSAGHPNESVVSSPHNSAPPPEPAPAP